MLQTHDVLRGWHRGYRNRLNVSLFWFLLLELFPFWKLLPLCAVHLHLRLLFRCLQSKWYFSMISCEIYVYFLFFHLSIYIVRASVWEISPVHFCIFVFLHFCIFRAGRQPSKKGTFVYIEWHTLALTKCCFPCFFSFPSSYLLNCRYIKQK